jgi:hypothetical protein
MSTKTSFKRIALVAVAALGMGVLTSVSASATTLTGKLGVTLSATPLSGATTAALTATTVGAPATFTAVGGSTVTLSVDMVTSAAVAATITTNADFTTSTSALTIASQSALDTNERQATFVAPSLAGTYYVAVNEATPATYAYLKLTVVNLGAKLGDGFSSTAGTATVASATQATLNAVAGPANTVTLSATRTASSGLGGVVTVSGGSSVIKTIGSGTISADKLSAEIANGGLSANDVVLTTPAAGTVTANFYAETSAGSGIYSPTATSTVTITVNAAAVTNVYNAAKSTVYANTGGSAGTEANNTTYSAAGALTAAATLNTATEVANVTVTQKDASGNNLTSGFKTVSATITGAGLLSTGTDATGASVSSSAAAVTTVAAYANGTNGPGVITVSVDGVVVKTITVIFYGAVKTLTATVAKSYVPVSTTNAAAVISVLAVDSLGQAVANTPVITSATPGVISSGTCAASNPATPVAAICTVTSTATAGSSVLTITAGGDATVTTTVTINVSKATANTAVLTTNKATYVPGEEATLTLTLTDADGKPLGSSDLTSAVATGGLKVSSAITTSLKFNSTDTTITVLDGKATVKFFVPTTPGPVTISGTLLAAHSASSADKVMTPVTFTVSDSATMSALTTLINSLIAKINALNKLVIKIQKKVKA